MAEQKFLPDYDEITVTHSGNRKCHFCNELIQCHYPYLHLRRKRHVFNICAKCLVIFSHSLTEDPNLERGRRKPTCHHCKQPVRDYYPYLHLERNRYKYDLCDQCIKTFAATTMNYDPLVQSDVVVELL
jgi:hypothetical protein